LNSSDTTKNYYLKLDVSTSKLSKRDKKTRKQRDSSQRTMVVIPYVENVSEAVARIIRNYNVPVAIKPHKTLKSVLVHPTDKQEKEDKLTECVYKVPCANCDKTYISETGRKFGVRLQEHRTELESKIGRTLTRSLRASSLTDPLSPTTQLKKRTMSSTGLKRR